MAKIAYLDCISGISGDMTLGALVDLGVEVAEIESAVRSMGIPELRIESETVKKCGFRAVQVKISHPPEHTHRHLHHLREMIERATEVSAPAKELAVRIFTQLAEAEAKVHGTTIEKVHFHEVGAIDSIADIVGSAVALCTLGIEQLVASPVPTGTGTITIAHGKVSIPAPATAELLRGVPVAQSDVEGELTTPTGAAILKACAERFGAMPSMTVEGVGYGAGTRDLPGQANVLRVLLGTAPQESGPAGFIESDQATVLETNLDDATPEQLADCADRLLAAGALDVFQTPCMMKKGRVGVVLSAIVPSPRVPLMEQILFEHSTSIGIRRYRVDRHKLIRESTIVETKFGPVRGKLIMLPSGRRRFAVEDDDARAIARQHQTNAEAVRREASSVFEKQ
jgi:uncharacterized protein (TIGR00299 family) protein